MKYTFILIVQKFKKTVAADSKVSIEAEKIVILARISFFYLPVLVLNEMLKKINRTKEVFSHVFILFRYFFFIVYWYFLN